MKYAYKCTQCGSEEIIAKPIADVDRVELCPACTLPMNRQISGGYFHFKDSNNAQYNPAFGKVTRTSRDIKNEVSRLYNEKGVRVEEVGNEIPKDRPTPSLNVDMQDAAEHLRAISKDHQRKTCQ